MNYVNSYQKTKKYFFYALNVSSIEELDNIYSELYQRYIYDVAKTDILSEIYIFRKENMLCVKNKNNFDSYAKQMKKYHKEKYNVQFDEKYV